MWVSEGFIFDIIKLSYLLFVFQAIFSCVLNDTFISGANVEVCSLPLCVPVPLLLRGAEESVVSSLVESFPWRWSTRSLIWTRDSTIFSLSKERTYEKKKKKEKQDWLTNLRYTEDKKNERRKKKTETKNGKTKDRKYKLTSLGSINFTFHVKQAHFKVLGPRLVIVRSFPALYI